MAKKADGKGTSPSNWSPITKKYKPVTKLASKAAKVKPKTKKA